MKTLLLALSLFSVSAFGQQPILIQPGQCVLVGSQQVCAAGVSPVAQPSPAPSTAVYCTCEQGIHKPTDPMAPMKGFGLYRVVEGKDGQQLSRTLIKIYYDLTDKGCQVGVEKLQACKVGL